MNMKNVMLIFLLLSAPLAQAAKYSCNIDGSTVTGSFGKSFIVLLANAPATVIKLDRVNLYAHIEIKNDSDEAVFAYQDATFFLTTTADNTTDYSAGIVTTKIKPGQKKILVGGRTKDGSMVLSCNRIPMNYDPNH